MVNLLKYRYKLCKKYGEDIWGIVTNKGKFSRLGEFLVNLESQPGTRSSRSDIYKKMLNDRKKVCLFYGGMKVSEFRRYCKEAKRITKGNFSDTVVSLLERRLDVFLYRINFVSSVAEGAALVKGGFILVNKNLVLTPYYLLQKGDFVEVREEFRMQVKNRLQYRLENEFFPVMYPSYTEVNYQILTGILLDYPKMCDVYYPFKLDEDFYYLSYFSRIV